MFRATTITIRISCLLLLSLMASKAVFACLPCGKDGVFITDIYPTSSQRLLAAKMAYFYSFSQSSDTGPLNPFNATVDIETGLISEGHPSGVDIYPSGLVRSEPPADFSEFILDIYPDGTAALRDPTIRESILFDLQGADTSDPGFTYGWFVSFKFKLAYVLYTKAQDIFDWAIAFVPISDRGGSVTYSDVGFLNTPGDTVGSMREGRWRAYDDIQTAHTETFVGQCYIFNTYFYNDTFFEMRPRLNGLLDVFFDFHSIQYGDTAEDTTIYRVVNGHECRDGDPYPEFYLWEVDLSTGAETRIDLSLFELQCDTLSCCEEDCCGGGTRWDGQKCNGDLSSGGWIGDYSDGYIPGCTVRRCCEEACCGERASWLESISSCVGDYDG